MANAANVLLDGIIKPIHLLLDNGFDRGALVLLYSGMDAMTFVICQRGRLVLLEKSTSLGQTNIFTFPV
jgi:hypothetical protein